MVPLPPTVTATIDKQIKVLKCTYRRTLDHHQTLQIKAAQQKQKCFSTSRSRTSSTERTNDVKIFNRTQIQFHQWSTPGTMMQHHAPAPSPLSSCHLPTPFPPCPSLPHKESSPKKLREPHFLCAPILIFDPHTLMFMTSCPYHTTEELKRTRNW